jgi:putative transposase
MITNRPRRLESVSYVGLHRYFVTTCTAYRRTIFNESPVAKEADERILHVSAEFEFAVAAYCFMPDHLHLVLMAQSEQSDLPRFMKQAKQVTGFDYRRRHPKPLWQPGYHDRILRDDEATLAVVRYVLENPIRAGLAQALGEWPSAGSHVYSWQELLTAWDDERT